MNRIVGRAGVAVFVAAIGLSEASAVNHSAATCSNADVQAAINAASHGDVVLVPAGSCTWTGVTVNKAITLQGAGSGATNINVSGSQRLTLTKQAAGVLRVQGFSFAASNVSGLPHPIVVQGSWRNAQPVILQNNAFTMNGATMIDVFVAGGVVISGNTFTGGVYDFSMTIKDAANGESWNTADSMGARDSAGTLNVYVENNVFEGQSNGVMDCDDNCRVVLRHNTLRYGGYNSHGKDTSPYGTRHFEIYNNTFLFPESTSNLANVNQVIWVRGGTGVIFNNSITNLTGMTWGDKPELRLSIRGAEDVRPQGACSSVSYPVPNQLGQNHDGTRSFTDPIYLWGNTGTVGISAGWSWGNPCGFNWSTFFQWGRDGVQGTAKPGYVPYAYPHPFAGATPPPAPLPAPTGLNVRS